MTILASYFDKRTFLLGLACTGIFYVLLVIAFAVLPKPINDRVPSETIAFNAPMSAQKDTTAEKTEESPTLTLPPFQANRLPVVTTENAKIALVIKDFGLSKRLSEKLTTLLPQNTTFLLNPYADIDADEPKTLKTKGFETWLEIPAQNAQGEQTGEVALSPSRIPSTNDAHFNTIISGFNGFAGVAISHDDTQKSLFQNTLRNIGHAIFSDGYGYLDLNPNAPSIIHDAAIEANAPYAKVYKDLLMNNDFEALETAAKTQSIVLTLSPYTTDMDALKNWLDTLSDKGITLVPLSTLADAS